MEDRLLAFCQGQKANGLLFVQLFNGWLVMDGSTAPPCDLWFSKFVVGCYVIIGAIYLARRRQSRSHARSPEKSIFSGSKAFWVPRQ
jgi:hypothetical protein